MAEGTYPAAEVGVVVAILARVEGDVPGGDERGNEEEGEDDEVMHGV